MTKTTKTTDAKSEDKAGEVRLLQSDELEAVVGGFTGSYGPGCGTKPPGPRWR
jgi:hypothetical protein